MDKQIKTMSQLKKCLAAKKTSFYMKSDEKGTLNFMTIERGSNPADPMLYIYTPLKEDYYEYSPDEFEKMWGDIMRDGKLYCKGG